MAEIALRFRHWCLKPVIGDWFAGDYGRFGALCAPAGANDRMAYGWTRDLPSRTGVAQLSNRPSAPSPRTT
jgi:hypothetical protein